MDQTAGAMSGAALLELIAQEIKKAVIASITSDKAFMESLALTTIQTIKASEVLKVELGEAIPVVELSDDELARLVGLKKFEDAAADAALNSTEFEDKVLNVLFDNGSKIGDWARNCRNFNWANNENVDCDCDGDTITVSEVVDSNRLEEKVNELIKEYFHGRTISVSLSNVTLEIEDLDP